MFPRLRQLIRQRAAENRLADLGFATYQPGMSKEEFRASMKQNIDLDPLRPVISELLGRIIERLLDFLFEQLSDVLGRGMVLPIESEQADTDAA